MKLVNKTKLSTKFLRRMICWICKQYGLKTKKINTVLVKAEGPRGYLNRGHARGRSLNASFCMTRYWKHPPPYPYLNLSYIGRKNFPKYDLYDFIESLISILAHELCHVDDYSQKVYKTKERLTETWMIRVLLRFRANRYKLLCAWHKKEKTVTPELPDTFMEEPILRSTNFDFLLATKMITKIKDLFNCDLLVRQMDDGAEAFHLSKLASDTQYYDVQNYLIGFTDALKHMVERPSNKSPGKYDSFLHFAAKLKPDEPWFVVRAQDILAPEVVRHYMTKLVAIGQSVSADNMEPLLKAFETWQQNNPTKVPD